eukprot:scaffold40637_cov66-Phaeocystis_antarctica.AAC.3
MTLLPTDFIASDREDGQLLHCARTCSPPPSASPKPQLTVRAVIVGLFVGTILCFTNMYFGLQTGWVTMGSLQCAMVGFAILKYCGAAHFNPLENVVVQTVGVATATMPLAGGFVGIIPALQLLDPPVRLTVGEQLAWCAALTYFGIFFAVPLRRQTILVEKLPFPSGTATSKLIEMLHSAGGSNGGGGGNGGDEGGEGRAPRAGELQTRWRTLGASFGLSFGVALLGFFVPPLANLKVFTWVCLPTLSAWHWTIRPSLSYVGQGIIMGPRSALSMLGGALAAWALLGPLAVWNGWVASVPYNDTLPKRAWCATPRVEAATIDSWEGGAQGWTLWVAMGLMLGEAVTSFGIILALQLRPQAPAQQRHHGETDLPRDHLPREMTSLPRAATARHADRADHRAGIDIGVAAGDAELVLPERASDESSSADEPALDGAAGAARGGRDRLEVAPPSELVPTSWWVGGLVLSVALCVSVLSPLFHIPAWQIGTSALLACLIAVLAVRALGQTDLNPVSAVGKLSQILFALLAPGHVVTNIVAGALAEAGAMQAGDLMQDLKTGHLLGASPRAQFFAQLIGSTASIFVTVAAFNLYATAYDCQATATWSCAQFQVPLAH